MTDLERAVAWLESQVSDEVSFDGEPDGCERAYLEHMQNCRVLLDALRWVPCSEKMPTEDDADEKGNVLCYWTDEAIETYQARWIEEWNSDRNHKDKITHWRHLPPKPEGKG